MVRVRGSLLTMGAVAALVLAGCARHAPPVPPPAPPAPPPFDRAAEVAAAAAALDRGDVAVARPRIDALFAHDPADPAGLTLRDAIDGDPRAALGPKNYAYTLKPGETLDDVAARVLGDPLRAYALARYNGLAAPVQAHPGMAIRIPGTAPVPPRPKPRPVPRRAAVAAPAAGAGEAARLRREALGLLAHGRRGEAVALLRRAAALDPDNPLVRRDLARAAR